MSKFSTYFNTIIFLHPIQILYRILFFIKPNLNYHLDYKINKLQKEIINTTERTSFIHPNKVRILDKVFILNSKFQWNQFSDNKLEIYTCNYLNFINDDGLNKKDIKKIIINWINQNSDKNLISWDSYPISLRIINLTKWCINNQDYDPIILDAIFLQLRWLNKRIEYHLSGNHLLTNFKALIYASILFNSYESNKYLLKGLKLFKRYLNKQTFKDGGNYERSIMYHSIITNDLIELVDILKSYKPVLYKDYISYLENKIDQYLHFYLHLCHPDNFPSFFGDTNYDNSYSYNHLISYAKNVLKKSNNSKRKKLEIFDQSGFFSFNNNNYYCVGDIGDFYKTDQPGHSHAASLSFELSIFGERCFVNSGISCYQEGIQRHLERSTKSHNTIEINDENSSQVWKSFRLGNRARIISSNYTIADEYSKISAEHNGYSKKDNKLCHKREWLFYKNKIEVNDFLSGEFKSAIARFFLHPDVKLIDQNTISLKSGREIKLHFEDVEFKIKKTKWHPFFNVSRPNQCIELKFNRNTSKFKIFI